MFSLPPSECVRLFCDRSLYRCRDARQCTDSSSQISKGRRDDVTLPSEKERSELFTDRTKELSLVEKTRLRSDDDLTQWKEGIG
jgi:hypothetical protein